MDIVGEWNDLRNGRLVFSCSFCKGRKEWSVSSVLKRVI